MPHLEDLDWAVELPEGWFVPAAGGQAAGGAPASSPWSVPAFFVGWTGVGVLLAVALGRRWHDRRLMIALGVGLGPLMTIVASPAVNTRRAARPPALAPGFDHGGDLDVLVLIQEAPESVRTVVPTFTAVAAEMRVLTLARVVTYEWLEEEGNEEIDAATWVLVAARQLVPIRLASLVLLPGTPALAARRFPEHRGRTLVLHAVDESADASLRW